MYYDVTKHYQYRTADGRHTGSEKTHLGFWCGIILNGFFIVQKQHIKLLGVVEPIQKVYSVYFCLSQKIYRQAGLYDRNTNYIGWQR